MPIYKGPSKFTDPVTCPYCDSGEVTMTSHISTLVGWLGEDAGDDPNHHTCGYTCKKCSAEFVYHYVISDQNGWYTGGVKGVDDWHCLKGKPSCCETSYLMPCQKCGTGWAKHSCHHQSRCFNEHGPAQAMYYQCIDCGDKTEDPKWPGHM